MPLPEAELRSIVEGLAGHPTRWSRAPQARFPPKGALVTLRRRNVQTLGNDDVRLTYDPISNQQRRETVGVRVANVQITVESFLVGVEAGDLADQIVTGFYRTSARDRLSAAGLALVDIGDVVVTEASANAAILQTAIVEVNFAYASTDIDVEAQGDTIETVNAPDGVIPNQPPPPAADPPDPVLG